MSHFLKKLTSLSILLLSIFVGGYNLVSAQSELLFGQKHFYSVVFRGNDEAVTYAKLVITNPGDTPLTEFSFEIPNVEPTELAVYQMKLPQRCTQYDYKASPQVCLQYSDPDYSTGYYYGGYGNSTGQTEYQVIHYTKSGNLYKLTLPTAIDPYKTSALIISYAAKGYVKNSMGLHTFNFETIKVPSRIEQIRVSVDVDSDLLMKGKKSSVNYGGIAQGGAVPVPNAMAISSVAMDKTVSNIGGYGALVKESKNLSPNESFNVRGEYATSWFRLYLSSILLSILIVVLIFVGIYFVSKLLKRYLEKSNPTGENTTPSTSTQEPTKSSSLFSVVNGAVSFASVLMVIGLTYLIQFLLESRILGSINSAVLGIVMFITVILLYVLVIFGPAIIVAIKHGWKSLLLILFAEFLWFLVFLAVYLTLFQSISKGYSGGIMY